jgi:hypothetical protein
METARKALENMKKGTVTVLWGFIVLRVGDRYIVGYDTISIHQRGVCIEAAAAIIARKEDAVVS